ncbi:hypothetical protein N658DRAFT_361112 [Parathielavia hyrcaniae]|uniref:Uncharacterized protein n=1 Tax=Parathielavia hyrcaniae TaxID=113614 RepID=A0AAN6PR94_9PEZI|nr:hypothetical protein N658DRAFT_361112 [Parathielavia hyrcaniae]
MTQLPRILLTSLPLEVLHHVSCYFCSHCLSDDFMRDIRWDRGMKQIWSDQPRIELLNLSKSCRLLRTVAQPVLCHFVCVNETKRQEFFSFVRTLVERPDLRSNVRQVVAGHVWPDWSGGLDSEGPTPEEQVSKPKLIATEVRDGLRKGDWRPLRDILGSSYVPRFQGGPQDERFIPLVSLLFHLTPNLESAVFACNGWPSHETAKALERWNSLIKLTSLKELFFGPNAKEEVEQGGFLLDDVFCLLGSVPELEVLHCDVYHRTGVDPRTRPALADPQCFPHLKELVLTNWHLDIGSLRHVLGAVGPGLTKFTLWQCLQHNIIHNFPSWRQETSGIVLDEALDALQPWRSTLTELSFRLHYHEDDRFDDPVPRSLSRIRELRVLDVDANSFGSAWLAKDEFASVLPPSFCTLKSLRGALRDGFAHMIAVPLGILEAIRAGQLPSLKKIELTDPLEVESIICTGQQWRDTDREWERLAGSFCLAGADLVFRDLDRYEERHDAPTPNGESEEADGYLLGFDA